MRTTPILTILVLLALPLAAAHSQVRQADVPATPASPGATFYVFEDDGDTRVFQETNGKLDGGAYAHADEPAVTGLQMDDVCYGTFSADDVTAYNVATYGRQSVSYVPWTQGADACAAAGGDFVSADLEIAGTDGLLP